MGNFNSSDSARKLKDAHGKNCIKRYKCLVTSAGDLSPSSTAVLGIKPAPGPATPICLRSGHAYTPTGVQGEVLTMTTRSQGGIMFTSSINRTEAVSRICKFAV